MRIGKLTANRSALIIFTNPMNFPNTDNFIAMNEASELRLINVYMLDGDEDIIDENLTSWSIVKVSSQLIELNFVFERPLSVSQGDNPDKLVIQAGLSEFTDVNQQRL